MTEMETGERRREPRRRTLRAGRILIDKKMVLSCTVRSISAHGSRVTIDSVVGVPDEFVLEIGDEPGRRAHVSWKSATEIGVALD